MVYLVLHYFLKIIVILLGQSVLLALLYHIIKCLARRQKLVSIFATSTGLIALPNHIIIMFVMRLVFV